MNSELFPFACPVCGRARRVSARVMREITVGNRSGECRAGEGCRDVSKPERLRRWWLVRCGIPEAEIRRYGGAARFVDRFGMPPLPSPPRMLAPVVRVPRPRPAGMDEPRARLPRYCFDQADGDPELAVWLAVEIIARGVPAHTLIDTPEGLAA